MIIIRPLALLLGGMALQTSQPVQRPPAAPTTPPDIVVEAQAQSALDRFVDQMTDHLNGKQIARWNHHICPKVVGLDPAHSAFLIDHITAAARKAGIGTIQSHCSADVVIIVTADADGFTRGFIKQYPRLFQDTSSGVAFLAGVKEALLKRRPVRWLNASSTGRAGGGEFYDGINQIYDASNLTQSSQENAVLSLAIVDAADMAHVSWGQLGDYLAMVSLARPAMDARYSDASILALFSLRDSGKKAPDGLTRTDSAFLKALYRTTPSASAEQERRQLKSSLRHGDH